jgi:hypothetical protein
MKTIQIKINALAGLQIFLAKLGLRQELFKNNGYLTSEEAYSDLIVQATEFIERVGLL